MRNPLARRANPSGSRHRATLQRRAPAALTAAAVAADRRNAPGLRRLNQPWQGLALARYQDVGECWYPAQFYARTMQRVRFYPALINDNGDLEEVSSGPLLALWDRVQDPGGGRSELTAAYGQLMFLTGDGYLIDTIDDGEEAWEFLSPLELRVLPESGARVSYRRLRAPGLTPEELVEAPDDAFEPLGGEARVYRLYRRDPGFSAWSDSPVRAVLELYQLLRMLTLAAAAEAQSRAANRGLLYVPDELSFASPDSQAGEEDAQEDTLLQDLIEGMMRAISDPGDAGAMAPFLMRGPGVVQTGLGTALPMGDLIKWLPLGPADSYRAVDAWDKVVARIGNGLDLPVEIVTGTGMTNHWCVDEETEILTDQGWRRHSAIGIGDIALTLNHESGQSEWQPIANVVRFKVDDLPMLRMESRCHSSLTTGGHRWPTIAKDTREARWRLSSELNTNDFIVTGAPCADVPEDPVHPDALVELAAWIWAEGSIEHRPGRLNPKVRIYQSHAKNLENVESIRDALSNLYGHATEGPLPSSRRGPLDTTPRWRETHRGERITEFALNVAAARPMVSVLLGKIVARDFIRELTRTQLQLFLDTCVKADGSARAIQDVVYQKHAHGLDAVELAAILLGRGVGRFSRTATGFTDHEQHLVSLHRRSLFGPKPRHKRTERYTGMIWCPVTANHSWLARRDGKVFYTGNSGWLLDEQGFRQHVAPVCDRFASDIVSAYLRPAAKADGFADWDRVTIGYDPADAVNHPDETGTVKDAHDRLIVSDAYYREAIGAGDDAAPDENELERRTLVKINIDPYQEPPPQGETAPADGGTGNDTTEAPPEAPATGNGQPPAAQAASALRAAHIVGAAEAHIHRARSLAGARLKNRSQACAECKERVRGLVASAIPAALGAEQVRSILEGHGSEADLVKGAGAELAEALGRWGIAPEWRAELGERVEQHALRTLYELEPPPLPAGFAAVVAKAVAA